jgi:hypothetical protein
MKRLLLFGATLAAAIGVSASAATADTCACGNGYPVLIGNAYGQCTWDYGPYASPRIRQAPC